MLLGRWPHAPGISWKASNPKGYRAQFQKRASLLPRVRQSKSNAALLAPVFMNLLIGGNPN